MSYLTLAVKAEMTKQALSVRFMKDYVIFDTIKVDSLKIYNLAPNNGFSNKSVFQIRVNALSKW